MISCKQLVRIISVVLLSALLVTNVIVSYEKYLDKKLMDIDSIYNDEIGKIYSLDIRDKGVVLLKNAAKYDDLLVLGSSELASDVPQNIKNFFPNSELNCNVNIVGRAYTQSLTNAIKAGALGEVLNNKKVVLIVSLQWFIQWLPMLGNEIDINGFNSNFSELQFYEFIKNKNISPENKAEVCKRVYELSKNESSMQRINILSYLYAKNSLISNAVLFAMSPYYRLRSHLLEIKDKHHTLKTLIKHKEDAQNVLHVINWDEEENIAEKMGQEACTNNDFYVCDEYYNLYIKPRLENLKNSNSSVDLSISKEWIDYETFLKICSELAIKPYLIIVPTNGFYYDYIGLNKEKRENFYNQIELMAKNYGFDYLDMREKEYEPYFFKDVMPLGWKGWLYVSKKITEYFK